MGNNDQDRYSSLLTQMQMPKSIKATMTIFGINVFDIGALFIGFFIGSGINSMINASAIMQLLIYGVSVATAIALIARTPWQPGVRNIRVLISVLMQDRKHYYPIRIAKKRKGR